ncbi:hypothetical protein NECAME_00953 [Necator americanus]|nr:hypothetical protein NECAME_00953 [Necator americanus]ETN70005.1 hypothetical protein NECAME_00953 [Necator americanus]
MTSRRLQPTMKAVDEMENCVDNTLTTVQTASALIRRTSTVVYHLEDSVNALVEASKLIPEKFENTVDVVKFM